MKFWLLLFALFTFVFGAEDNNTIVQITEQLEQLNSQINILKAQTDSNSSKANLAILNDKKAKLLEQIPFFITQISIKESEIKKFRVKKAELEKIVKRYENSQNKTAYVQNAIELESMNIAQAYYTTLIELEEMFKNGTHAKAIRELINSGLLTLQTNSYTNIEELKSLDTNKFDAQINALQLQKQSSEEILNYLKTNADLLSSNSILSELNLTTAIEFINKQIPTLASKFNIGKSVIIFAVFVFFISLTRILAKLTYLVLTILSKQDGTDEKEQILIIVKRPIAYLLIIYALKICVGIGFYPVPIPISIATALSIAYILGFGWLALTMLNGYGLIIISELTKKSGRKEVINLIIKIIYFIIIIITILLILARLGFDISAIIASLGIGGLAVAFAAKDIIANFFASVMLLFDNSFSQGDRIVCGNIDGTIVEIGLRKTSIRSFDNALIFVPNSKLASEPIINWSRRKAGRLINMTIGLTYDSKPEQILKCMSEIKSMLLANPKISKPDNGGSFISDNRRLKFKQNIVSIDDLAGYKNELYVALDKLNDSSIDILIYCFTKTTIRAEFLQVQQEIILGIMDIIAKNNLSFAFPSQSLYVENSDKNELPFVAKQDERSEV
ncbi:mechanosensitive ion channel domain-containing protein [Campylobacter mucosalis]|uniref:Mechanosensitive ion channel family protein n=1 Tax=Campylobacter mucosalis CCUG 21559 TaxID=1032067 RepID=A0A6G5QIX8_9BACT|nr:mechanosensitive ion channel domain-containing protein [Campylobacter mucosalis]QCD45645.1 mechanosensitive ion channel family protein [Campylobacter mucosalis CCUG 21559]